MNTVTAKLFVSSMFTKNEIFGLLVIFLFLILATYFGFSESYKRQRDIQRNLDVAAISQALEFYYKDYGYYPESKDGMIVACAGPETKIKRDANGQAVFVSSKFSKPILENLVSCVWGESQLIDVNDVNYPSYLSHIPDDPIQNKGFSYLYESNGESYQIFGSFETKYRMEYDDLIKDRGLMCGKKMCNFGKSSPDVNIHEPLSGVY